MQLPQFFLDSLKSVKGFERVAFEKVHETGERVTSLRINPFKTLMHMEALPVLKGLDGVVRWSQYGFYLSQRPSFTFDPLFHAGCYYVQEASSMFLEQALKQTVDLAQPLKILDLCAAPGGKSTHIQSLISKDSLLVSNEVIKSRNNILKDNIIKWGSSNVIVTNNNPKDFARLENYFDVIVVDAPCSGSGLFRKDPAAIEEWSLNNVQLCSWRQQQILADVWPALKKNGILIYCTCSYSEEEDEAIAAWMIKNLPIVHCQLAMDNSWGIVESSSGYRFWPDKIKGEGFYIASFRKEDGDEYSSFQSKYKPVLLGNKEMNLVNEWLRPNDHRLIRSEKSIYVVPLSLLPDILLLSATVNVSYSGVSIGELIRDKFIPDHSLAMSDLVGETVKRNSLDEPDAINFLKKKNIHIDPDNKGWNLITFMGCNLGWVNVP